MRISGVTIGLPVTDLAAACAWYERVVELSGPDLTPVDGLVEYNIGPIWLQLAVDAAAPPSRVVVRFEVADVDAERERLLGLGIDVPTVESVPGVISFIDFCDPDGNRLSFYSLATP